MIAPGSATEIAPTLTGSVNAADSATPGKSNPVTSMRMKSWIMLSND